MRDEFLSVASHELRAPLTALTLQVKLAQRCLAPDGPGAASLPSRVTGLARQIERLNRLVANLLDVTRLRVGRMDLSIEPIELAELVEEVSSHFEEELARQGRELRLACAGPVHGRWDRVKVEQVVTNLLSNAVRYGVSGPVELSVTQSGEVAELAVRDHGPGIKPEDQARIFDRYERGRASEGNGGLGLGLYLVRTLVELHGGCVRLESAPGQGTSFTVELPLQPPATVDADSPPAPDA